MKVFLFCTVREGSSFAPPACRSPRRSTWRSIRRFTGRFSVVADEAWYYVGMLNSDAMTEAISPFNPKGDFGEHHIHTLPYKLMPDYDAANDDHARIATLAREIAEEVKTRIATDKYLDDPSRALIMRRRKLRRSLRDYPLFQEMEQLCAKALGTTAFGGDADTGEED